MTRIAAEMLKSYQGTALNISSKVEITMLILSATPRACLNPPDAKQCAAMIAFFVGKREVDRAKRGPDEIGQRKRQHSRRADRRKDVV
jgi:hypothetical protein